tara:strand:- start:144 stop:452 length:309 start_codon:yes stop_codon:yes gene_type:complete
LITNLSGASASQVVADVVASERHQVVDPIPNVFDVGKDFAIHIGVHLFDLVFLCFLFVSTTRAPRTAFFGAAKATIGWLSIDRAGGGQRQPQQVGTANIIFC